MAGITLAQAEAKLTLWLDAEDNIAAGQSYSISTEQGSRSLSRADLAEVRSQIDYWERKVKRLSGGRSGGPRVRGITKT